ncbi:MAG: hypothetical protein IPF99_28615 [Deltaproteobacteria bacterium]|nr:hypothetical protein [Deltaproteobacteria bacterium]
MTDVPAAVDAGEAPPEDVPPMVIDDVPDPDVAEPPLVGACDALALGWSLVPRRLLDRSFILTLPPGATAPGGRWAVVFNWHGLGDSAPNMNPLFAGEVGNAAMPFILVTPVSTRLGPTTSPLGLEWENLRATTPNREARLFDAVLRCLDQRWGVDRDRVYTATFRGRDHVRPAGRAARIAARRHRELLRGLLLQPREPSHARPAAHLPRVARAP